MCLLLLTACSPPTSRFGTAIYQVYWQSIRSCKRNVYACYIGWWLQCWFVIFRYCKIWAPWNCAILCMTVVTWSMYTYPSDSRHWKTLIDLCFTFYPAQSTCSGVSTTDLSDHIPIFCFFPHLARIKTNKNGETPLTYRDNNANTLERFYSLVSETNWGGVYLETNPNRSYEVFLRKIHHTYCEVFPSKQLKGQKKSRKPWITSQFLRRISNRNKLFDKFIK